ncbi:MAG: protoporphyrinogen oxidase [Isosphaeraceae bacterium]|jgi:oxygen-dependent protoporphyrinogen oxidase|nr:MAG: protoporphyrinogen oxidase [Isosphaeraceae bacterium]
MSTISRDGVKPFPVVVVGGGLSGLATAYRLSAVGGLRSAVVVLEAKDRAGGAIWTERVEGFVLEGGADSFITTKPWAVELCRELGLGDELMGTQPAHRRSFVVRGQRLVPVPEGFVLMAPTRLLPVLASPILSWRGKVRLLLDLIWPRRGDEQGDESLASFARRRLGREVLERLVQPLVGGIYTADPNELSVAATLPQFVEMERRHGSLIRAAWRQARIGSAVEGESSGARYGLFLTLRGGMETLPRALAARLPEGAMRLSTPVRRVEWVERLGRWVVELFDGGEIEASAVVLATEAHAAARLVDGYDPVLAQRLREIPYASSIVVNLAYARDAVAHPLDGFGVVVPAVEGRSILAVSFTSVKFADRAPAGTVLMRVFVGGAMQPALFDLDDDQVEQLVRRELAELIGARGEPLLVRVARHRRSMPQYTVGHAARVAAIRDRLRAHPGLFVTGNAFDGVGVPDCIRSAEATAEAVVAYLRGRAQIAAA